MRYWKRFVECDCKSEGIMVSYEYDENAIPFIDLAFFKHENKFTRDTLNLWYRLRWCWQIIWFGQPYTDMVILDKRAAKELMNELKLFLASGDGYDENEEAGRTSKCYSEGIA